MACFLSRLPAKEAQAALGEVEAGFAATGAEGKPGSAEEAEYPWDLYFDFVGLLKERVAKVGAGN